MSLIRLSPSTLSIFRECPRCFWLHINKGIKRPRGIFPSLPGGIDRVLKDYFDQYRLKGAQPPEIAGKVRGRLMPDIAVLEKWRNWRTTDLNYEDKALSARLIGALDDCLTDEGYYIPLDYKTRGSPLQSDPRIYYQNQLDSYCLMLEANGYKTKGIAYLLYYYPNIVKESGIVQFNVEPIEVETNIESARRVFEGAVGLLRGQMPQEGPNCEYCQWARDSIQNADIK